MDLVIFCMRFSAVRPLCTLYLAFLIIDKDGVDLDVREQEETLAEDTDTISFSFGSNPLLRLLTLCTGEAAAAAAASACAFSSASFWSRLPTILMYQFETTEVIKLVAAATT